MAKFSILSCALIALLALVEVHAESSQVEVHAESSQAKDVRFVIVSPPAQPVLTSHTLTQLCVNLSVICLQAQVREVQYCIFS